MLGVGGKIGPTPRAARQARGARQARRRRRALQRAGPARGAHGRGIECIAADLLDRKQIEALPKLPNVVFMAGRKFGSAGHEDLTWAMNAHVPALVAEAFAGSRIVAYSTGCVYPYVNVHHGGATEATPATPPPGAYANSCVAREAMFQYFSRTRGTPGRIIRLNYAIDMRYGVLHDVAARVLVRPADRSRGRPRQRDLAGRRQCHGAARARSLHGAVEPAQCQRAGDRERALAGGSSSGSAWARPPVFTGVEAAEGWLVNTAEAMRLFGYPSVPLATLIDWTADWVGRGMPSLGKDTHYDTRDGNF